MRGRGLARFGAAALALLLPTETLAAESLVEFHFQPVEDAQIAIWITTADGRFVKDVMVTQATGTLGIGNRPGRTDFLSSWRFPYGPRTGVLPVWGHARGKTYPKLVFHDDDADDQNSLGWHEDSSSVEAYFCRPLSETENDLFRYDIMTCPSPSTFHTDKGEFTDGTSVYPPRSDYTTFDATHDSEDVKEFATLNDLDGITRATPHGDTPARFSVRLTPEEVALGPLTAWIEVNVEHDENADWEFDREDDYYIESRLSGYGIEWWGQPSIVYSVEFDPTRVGFTSTSVYAGYGDLLGESGEVHPPDPTISTTAGSGADRLELFNKGGEMFRFGVYNYGDDPDPGGWGDCMTRTLPAMNDVEVEAVSFDRVRVHFTVPSVAGGDASEVMALRLYYLLGDMPLTEENLGSALQRVPKPDDCGAEIKPGVSTWCEIGELFGATNYQVGVVYEDSCTNTSDVVAEPVTTPRQEFAVVEGFCFIATAAYGAAWADKVQAMRWFRGRVLETNAFGAAAVAFYYSASPGLASLIAERPVARSLARVVLGPAAELAEAVAGGSWSRSRIAGRADQR